jgi:hypothetical protein
MRHATAADAERIRVIARLDDRRMPEGPSLVAEVAGEIVAARSLSTGAVVADPWRPTDDAVAMLSLRAAQVGAGELAEQRRARRSRAAGRTQTAAVAA